MRNIQFFIYTLLFLGLFGCENRWEFLGLENNPPQLFFKSSVGVLIDENGNPYTEIPSQTLFDFGATYQLTEELQVRASVQNLFDWEASPKETAIGRWTYGRTYNVGVTARF